MKRLALIVLLAAGTVPAQDRDETAALRAFTGARMKQAWVQQVAGEGDDPICWTDQHLLRVLEPDDGLGERTLFGAVTNDPRPLITPRGDRVVFSRFSNRTFYVVHWDGTGLHELGAGYALAVWRDPVKGVYFTRTAKAREWDQHLGPPGRRFKGVSWS